MSSEAGGFQPYVPPSEDAPELTLRALVVGSVLGILFGAASTYLALRVGLTVSASVPIAVIAIAILKRRRGRSAILEHNVTQTVGSAGESIAAAVVFTVPALIFLGYPLKVDQTTLVALTGGILGVLMMVPLRRYLIVKEHGVLRYPEGKACAEILIAGEKGGTSARKVFIGMALGAAFKAFQSILVGLKTAVAVPIHAVKGWSLDCAFEPPLLGVGYIIGYRTSVMMVAGSLLSSFVLIPMVMYFGQTSTIPVPPSIVAIPGMNEAAVWGRYVRYIGAGAVAAGGIFGLIRALPAIATSLTASARSLRGGGAAATGTILRTERDTPVWILLAGSVGLVILIWALPVFQMTLLGAFLILVLGFLFSVVSSRITGEVGSSSSPLSGMTIGVLMGTCGMFLAVGWEGSIYSRLALMVGAIVCVAISNAGTCSQDLKTGFLVGATPVRQQVALLVGVLTSVLAVGWTAYLLNLADMKETAVAPFPVDSAVVARAETDHRKPVENQPEDTKAYAVVKLDTDQLPAGLAAGNYLVDPQTNQAQFLREEGIGRGRFPAPQSRLMSVIIDGLLTRKLPWDLILIGVAIAIFIEILGFRSLTFAVGVYLPLESTMPVFIGGLARKLADRAYKRTPDAEDEPEGTLWCSGLIAGASLVGILTTTLSFLDGYDQDLGYHPKFALLSPWLDSLGKGADVLTGIAIFAIAFLIFRGARPPRSEAKV